MENDFFNIIIRNLIFVVDLELYTDIIIIHVFNILPTFIICINYQAEDNKRFVLAKRKNTLTSFFLYAST